MDATNARELAREIVRDWLNDMKRRNGFLDVLQATPTPTQGDANTRDIIRWIHDGAAYRFRHHPVHFERRVDVEGRRGALSPS